MWGASVGFRAGKGSGSFLKKRTKKLLIPLGFPDQARWLGSRSFCFFSKKKRFIKPAPPLSP
jgi:hypothetical protein